MVYTSHTNLYISFSLAASYQKETNHILKEDNHDKPNE